MPVIRHKTEKPETSPKEPAAGTALVRMNELPSEFKPYPKNAEIWYRTYTFDEIDSFNNYGSMSALERLEFIASAVETRNMKKDDMTVQDLLYAGLLNKLSTFGTRTFSVHIRHDDNSEHTVTYNLNDLYFEELQAPDLPVETTIQGQLLRFMPITLAMCKKLGDKMPDDGKLSAGDALAAQCVNMEFNDARLLIGGSSGNDMMVLKEIHRILSHGVQPLDAVYTLEDGTEVRRSVGLTNPRTLVYPFREQGISFGNAIRFGARRNS